MHSAAEEERKYDEKDWALFTSYILLLSACSRVAGDEIDGLVLSGCPDHRLEELKRAQRSFAAFASIADHYHQKGDC